MENISLAFNNCFGIESLKKDFNFTKGNVISIYAKNGLMKTSFAKTFQRIQQGKKKEIGDVVFKIPGSASVVLDGEEIQNDKIFVIKSFENMYESDISSLLIRGEIQSQLQEVFALRDKLFKTLEKLSGLRIKRTSLGKTVYELEPQIIKDFEFKEDSLLLNLDNILEYRTTLDLSSIQYSSIFDTSVQKKILDPKFQDGIGRFIAASNKVYEKFSYLEKGALTLPKIKDLKKSLEKNSFFVKNNRIVLSGVKWTPFDGLGPCNN